MPSKTGVWSQEEAATGHLFSYRLAQFIGQLLRNNKNITVWDFGCGPGSYLRYLEDIGYRNLIGVEGSDLSEFEVSKEKIILHDLTKRGIVDVTKGHVICLEVAEHIPGEFERIFLDHICSRVIDNGYLILSWAVPGQDGIGHVNCKTNEEVEAILNDYGFEVCVNHSVKARLVVENHLAYFKDTVLVFKKV